MNNLEKGSKEEISDGYEAKEGRRRTGESQDSQHGKRNYDMSREGCDTTADNIDNADNLEKMDTAEEAEIEETGSEASIGILEHLEPQCSLIQPCPVVGETDPEKEAEPCRKPFPRYFSPAKLSFSQTCDKTKDEEPLNGPFTNVAWINLNLDNFNSLDAEILGEDFYFYPDPTYSISQLPILAGTKRIPTDPQDSPLDPTLDLLSRNQRNLEMLHKEICRIRQVTLKTGVPLTEEIVRELLMQCGDVLEMYLPGNQLYPNLLRRRINDEDISVITNVLLENCEISKLNLCYNEIHDEGLEALAAVIESCENIVDVNLMHNEFTAKGLLSLVRHLMRRSPLESLRLTGVKVGDEGIRVLACLILSGHCPKDLDFSECDMTCESFQSICSALHAVDNDIDYPHFLLLTNSLPIDLVSLKDIRTSFNHGLSHVYDLFESSNLFVAAPPQRDGDNNAFKPGPLIACYPHDKRSVYHLFEAFSTTILEGLIELSHRFEPRSTEAQHSGFTVSEFRAKVEEKAQEIIQQGAVHVVDRSVEYLPSSRQNKCVNPANKDFHEEGELIIVRKSLYSLDLNDDEDTECKMTILDLPSTSGPATDESNLPSLNDSLVERANAAADKITSELLEEAVKSNTICQEDHRRMDVAQLLIMSITETLERIGKSSRLTETEIEQIIDSSLEGTKKLIHQNQSQVSGDGSVFVCREDMEVFLRKVFEISQGTFVKLLGNPVILKTLTHQTPSKPVQRSSFEEELPNKNQAFDIAVSFLHGVLLESARFAGTTNPHLGPEDADIYTRAAASALECLTRLIPAAGFMASEAKERGKMALSLQMNFEKAADEFVINLFEDIVTMAVGPAGDRCNSSNSRKHHLTKNVARPSRLVMNRPLFRERAPLMANALGHYIATNSSLVSLHLSKWELGEEGMEELMNPMMRNLNLVALNLSSNKLGAGGMKLLAKYLQVNKNLKHLVLRNNPIRSSGMSHLIPVLEASSLQSLDIAHGDVSPGEMDKLLRIIPKTKITCLYMWGNRFGFQSLMALECMFAHGILDSKRTDTLVQRTSDQLFVVENKQIRDMNEYYEVPAKEDANMSISAIYLDTSHRTKSNI